MRVAASLQGSGGERNGSMTRYEVLRGTTDLAEYNAANGWPVSSFLSYTNSTD